MLFDQQMEGDCRTQKDGSEVIVLQGWEGHGHEKDHGGKTRKMIKNNVSQHVPASYFNFDKFQLPGKLLAWETESRKAF